MSNQYFILENGSTSGPDVTDECSVNGPFSSIKEAREHILASAEDCYDTDGQYLGVNKDFGSRCTIVQVVDTLVAEPTLRVSFNLRRQKTEEETE